jgi:hypothetical protein
MIWLIFTEDKKSNMKKREEQADGTVSFASNYNCTKL